MYFLFYVVACIFLSANCVNAQNETSTEPPLNSLLVADLNGISFTQDKSKGNFPEPPSFNSIFHVEKGDFSFYLWPREECSVIEMVGTELIKYGIPVSGNEKIVFTAMEQRVAYYVWERPVKETQTMEQTTPTAAPATTNEEAPKPEKKALQKRSVVEEPIKETPASEDTKVQHKADEGQSAAGAIGTESKTEPSENPSAETPVPTTETTTTTEMPPAKRWVLKKAEYYPYVKVDFNEKDGQYKLKVRGSSSDENCDVAKCVAEDSEIVFNATNYLLIMTNSPYCATSLLTRKQEGIKSNSFFRTTQEKKEHYKTKRFENQQRDYNLLAPLNGIKADGSIKLDTELKKCCPSETQISQLPHSITWLKHENAVAMHYLFKYTPSDVYHTSFLIEMVDAGNCEWIRLCFNNENCKDGRAVLDILPRSGLLIRPDDDRAEYLGEHGDLINKIRVSVSENILVLRYGGIHRDASGIRTPIYLKQKLQNDYHVWLLKSAGCQARLNNDFISNADGRVPKYNNLELTECKCFSQD